MTRATTVSQRGLEQLFEHEGVVHGVYDCPARHATFGMGTLLHHGPSELLMAVQAAVKAPRPAKGPTPADLGAHLKIYQPSAKSPKIPYLAAEAGQATGYTEIVEGLLKGCEAGKARRIQRESAHLAAGWDAYLASYRASIGKYEKAIVTTFAGTELTQDQFDGLFSLTYNIGVQGLASNGALIRTMKDFVKATASLPAKDPQRDAAAAALLDQILRARPTAPAPVSGQVESVSFRLTESGVFNSGLFKRRVVEAGQILGRKYKLDDAVIKIARQTIKAERDHQTTTAAKAQVRAIVEGLSAINHLNRH